MSSWTSPEKRARPLSFTTIPRRLSRLAHRPTTSTQAVRTRWMPAARPPRSRATVPTPGPSCRSGWWLDRIWHLTLLLRTSTRCGPRGQRAKRGVFEVIPGPDHHSSGRLQLRLQQHVPVDCCRPVYPDRRYTEDLPAYQRRRGASARCHDAAGDEGECMTRWAACTTPCSAV